jgi:hypothetical protein
VSAGAANPQPIHRKSSRFGLFFWDVEVTYSVTWGAPETPPAYAHGGLPADPDEIDDLRLRSIDGVGGPFDQILLYKSYSSYGYNP